MFEYLMPTLLLREPADSLMGRACAAAVQTQIAYADRRGVPWGMSESGYYRFDAHRNYQYRAFGVPDLGFKRGLEDDVVVAPYASLLALPFALPAVMANLDRLDDLGLMGRYGLYEAVDFTASRLDAGTTHAIVRSFMAHHQGMILTAIDNLLHGEPMVRRFHADAIVRTTEALLFERPATAPRKRTRLVRAILALLRPGGRPSSRGRRVPTQAFRRPMCCPTVAIAFSSRMAATAATGAPWPSRAGGPTARSTAPDSGCTFAISTAGSRGPWRPATARWCSTPTWSRGVSASTTSRSTSRSASRRTTTSRYGW